MEKNSASATNEKVSDYISDDIAFSILSKLPLKSLKRFGCVRKSWSHLFENDNFMNMFRNNFLSNLNSCSYYDGASLFLMMAKPHNVDLYSLSGERFEYKFNFDWPNPFENKTYYHILGLGSVNGTLCVHQHIFNFQYALWTPDTNKMKLVPLSPIQLIESFLPIGAQTIARINDIDYLHGFGYDSVIDDYKIIRYLCYECNRVKAPMIDIFGNISLREISLSPTWEIYSLRSNSWRQLYLDMPYSLECNDGTQVYMDGVCHWFCENDYDSLEKFYSSSGPCLVSFNLNNEVFFTTPIPYSINGYIDVDALRINLAVLNGSIALFSYDERTTIFRISVLGEIGSKESWTKLFTVGPLPNVERPIGVGTKGEIFFISKDNEVAWFDLRTQTAEELGVTGGGPTTRIIICK